MGGEQLVNKEISNAHTARIVAPRRQRGFTLIEMAVVLLLFGVLMGGGLVGFGHFTHQIKTAKTQERFDIVMNALSVYAQRHKRLPCPADPNGAGLERLNGLCFNNTSTASLYDDTQGVLPWRELGLPESVARDGWGRFITYKPAPQLTANYLDPTMQNVNAGAGDLDINDACRSPAWFSTSVNGTNVTHTHVDRARAMFCCATPPRQTYLDAYQTAGAGLPGNWRNQAIIPAGALDPTGLDTTSTMPAATVVTATAAWTDVETSNALNGDFAVPDHYLNSNGPDAPMARTINSAVTLISHGGNGFLSFLRAAPPTARSVATVNPATGIAAAQAALGNDERLNVWPPQVAAATVFHPKTSGGAYDPLGRRSGASDDHVATLRTDQLFSRAGSASCLRPADFDEVCIPGTYDDVIYLLDTSGSMNCPLFGPGSGSCGGNANANSRITIAKDILREIMRAHMARELRDDLDFDQIGYSGFTGNNPQHTDANAFLQTAFYEGDLNNDGAVDAADTAIGTLDEAVRLYNIAVNGINSPDYDGLGDGFTDADLIEARVDFAMDEVENTLSGVNASGCTPVIESTQVMSDILLAEATTKICRQLVVERNPDGTPAYGMPSDCAPVIAEYGTTPAERDAFIATYNPQPFDPYDIDPNSVVLLSDGNDTCSTGLDVNGNQISLPNIENLNNAGNIAQVRQIYSEQGQRIADKVAAFNQKFNDAFAANGDGITIAKELHVNIVDVIGNEGLVDFAQATGGTRSATSNVNQIMQNMSIFSGACPPNS